MVRFYTTLRATNFFRVATLVQKHHDTENASQECVKCTEFGHFIMFRSELLPFRGSKRKKGPQKRVRTRFLNNPMSSQLFFQLNS